MGFVIIIVVLFLTALLVDAVKILWRMLRRYTAAKKLEISKTLEDQKPEALRQLH